MFSEKGMKLGGLNRIFAGKLNLIAQFFYSGVLYYRLRAEPLALGCGEQLEQ